MSKIEDIEGILTAIDHVCVTRAYRVDRGDHRSLTENDVAMILEIKGADEAMHSPYFHGIVFPDSIGHNVVYRETELGGCGDVRLHNQNLLDKDLGRTYTASYCALRD